MLTAIFFLTFFMFYFIFIFGEFPLRLKYLDFQCHRAKFTNKSFGIHFTLMFISTMASSIHGTLKKAKHENVCTHSARTSRYVCTGICTYIFLWMYRYKTNFLKHLPKKRKFNGMQWTSTEVDTPSTECKPGCILFWFIKKCLSIWNRYIYIYI